MSARNVLNTEAVTGFTESLSELARHDEVAQWVRTTARRWILRKHDRHYRIERAGDGSILLVDRAAVDGDDSRRYDGIVPDWCGSALDAGGEVLFLRLDGTLNKTVRHAIEYLDALADGGEARKIGRMSFDRAVRAAARMRSDRYARRRPAFEQGAIPVYRYGPHAVVVQLTTPENLMREGDRMKHCVAIYADAVRLGECEVYSVRDAQGEPHATIEVDPDGYVLQVKGRLNGPVTGEYKGVARDFIRSRGYSMLADFENVAFAIPAIAPYAKEFDEYLCSPEGQAMLRSVRFFGGGFEIDVEAGARFNLLRDGCCDLRRETERAVFKAISPGRGAPVLLRQIGGYWVYDEFIALVRVDIPLLLLSLLRSGAFGDARQRAEGDRIRRAVEGILPTLVFRELDRVYLLGGTQSTSYDWRFCKWDSTADFLLDSPVDIRDQRSNRHRALLERMNEAKRRVVGRRPAASEAHIAVRRIITGTAGVYAI